MIKSSFEAYAIGQDEAILQKSLDDCLETVINGDYENYGIKDSLKIVSIGSDFISFVPLWVDDSHRTRFEHAIPGLLEKNPFILNRPVKAGSAIPLAELMTSHNTKKNVSVLLEKREDLDESQADDKVLLEETVEPNRVIQFLFQPDSAHFPDTMMTIRFSDGKVRRTYKGKTDVLPLKGIPGVEFSDFKIRYFDNTNTEIEPKTELIPMITAIQVSVRASLRGEFKNKKKVRISREGFLYVGLRNSRMAGTGLLIREGTKIKIPDSRNIRLFSLSNVTGIRKGGRIELEAKPERGTIWRISIELGYKGKVPILKKYHVHYPPGRTLYSETINLTTDLPFSLMTLGGTGRYDYDFDEDVKDVVDLKGNVELTVTRMDASGAMLYIRP